LGMRKEEKVLKPSEGKRPAACKAPEELWGAKKVRKGVQAESSRKGLWNDDVSYLMTGVRGGESLKSNNGGKR